MNALVLRSAIVAALGGLLFGFDTAVISGTTQQLTRFYELSPGGLGFTVATALIGTIVGALAAGKPVDRYGRKKVLFAIGILYLVGALGTGLVSNLALFQIFRFLGGIGVGVASVVAPIYTAEIAPPKYRGPARRARPVQHRAGHPAGLPVELHHRRDSCRPTSRGAGCSS